MNNTKFTKGKWSISRNKELNDRTIAKLTDNLCIVSDSYVSDDPMFDASLISAAPEMYEMLLEILESEELPYCNSDISKLLAKARGENNE